MPATVDPPRQESYPDSWQRLRADAASVMPRTFPNVPTEVTMAELQLTLTVEEQAFLAELLETVQKESRVEEHRTRTPSYREQVIHREDLIAALLKKLGPARK